MPLSIEEEERNAVRKSVRVVSLSLGTYPSEVIDNFSEISFSPVKGFVLKLASLESYKFQSIPWGVKIIIIGLEVCGKLHFWTLAVHYGRRQGSSIYWLGITYYPELR